MLFEIEDIVPGAVGSRRYDSRIARRYVALEGLRLDLSEIGQCLDRCIQILASDQWDTQALCALTWQAIVGYARCFEDVSDGRHGTLSIRALRLLTNDEEGLHQGLLKLRHKRFAHAGVSAKHECTVSLISVDGNTTLRPGVLIERPTGIKDPEQAALWRAIINKLVKHVDDELRSVRRALDRELSSAPAIRDVVVPIEKDRTMATPQATAQRLMRLLGL